jgi:hypothetical protein
VDFWIGFSTMFVGVEMSGFWIGMVAVIWNRSGVGSLGLLEMIIRGMEHKRIKGIGMETKTSWSLLQILD